MTRHDDGDDDHQLVTMTKMTEGAESSYHASTMMIRPVTSPTLNRIYRGLTEHQAACFSMGGLPSKY